MKKQYISPALSVADIETQNILAASPGVGSDGLSVDPSTPETGGDAGGAAAKGHDMWDDCEEE